MVEAASYCAIESTKNDYGFPIGMLLPDQKNIKRDLWKMLLEYAVDIYFDIFFALSPSCNFYNNEKAKHTYQ